VIVYCYFDKGGNGSGYCPYGESYKAYHKANTYVRDELDSVDEISVS
jgi:hypothetical protein